MKKMILMSTIILLSIACAPKNSYTSNYNIMSSTVKLDDGTEVLGKIDYPLNAIESKVKVKDVNNKTIKIDKKLISKIVCATTSGPIEYENMKVYKGWNATKIHKRRIILGTSMKGEVTLYFCNRSFRQNTGGNSSIWVSEIYYYCKRDNEPAATLIHIDMNMKAIGKNSTFRHFGRKYFADNSEIVDKIDKREYTYENLFEVVALYNSKFKTK